MHGTFKGALAGIVALGVVGTAQASYVSGDLLVGFYQSGSLNGQDYIYDLGSVTSLYNGESWNLGTGLSGQFSTLNNVNFGLVGALSSSPVWGASIWSTTDGTFQPSLVANGFSSVRTAVASIGSTLTVGNAITPDNTTDNSWHQQTIVGPHPTSFVNVLDNPNAITPGNFSSGSVLAELYSNDNFGDPAIDQGTFSLAPNGTLSFSAVPEPSSLGLLGGFTILALIFRRRIQRIS